MMTSSRSLGFQLKNRFIAFCIALVMGGFVCSHAAPILTGNTDNSLTQFHWEVYSDSASDNPRPVAGQFTYVYWQEVTGSFTQSLYWVRGLGAQLPDSLGEISATGFIPNTGIAPDVIAGADWRWNPAQGISLNPGQRTASLFINSPDYPGPISADIANCNPLVCFYPTTDIVGPVSIASDFDQSGQVDSIDLDRWRSSFGNSNFADADNDGDSDGADLLTWQRQYNTAPLSTISSAFAVPEPASSTYTMFLMGLYAFAKTKHRT